MSTIYAASPASTNNTREKGMRRPLGPINVNRADTSSTTKKSNSSTAKSVLIKPSGHHRRLSNQSINSELSSSSSSANGVARSSTTTTVVGDDTPTTTATVSHSSIFRSRRHDPFTIKDDAPTAHPPLPPRSDLLSLKRANPVSEDNSDKENEGIYEDDDGLYSAMSFPFTRLNNTIVYEPFDTMQLRSIFRRPFMNTPNLDERMEKEGLALRLANAISELDEEDVDDGDHHRSQNISDEQSLPSLLSSASESSSNGRNTTTQTLEWGGLVSDGTAIIDLMTM